MTVTTPVLIAPYYVTQPYGYTTVDVEPWFNGRHFHCGIDLSRATCYHEPLRAARAGVVFWLSPGILGLRHASGEQDWYVHGEYSVRVGEWIAAGEDIGVVSNIVPSGGSSTGAHLHFERQSAAGWINHPATSLDPMPVLVPTAGAATSGGTVTTQEVNPLLFYKDSVSGALYIVGESGKRYVWSFEGTDWQNKLGAPVVKSTADLAVIPDAPYLHGTASLNDPAKHVASEAQVAEIKAIVDKLSAASAPAGVDLKPVLDAIAALSARVPTHAIVTLS